MRTSHARFLVALCLITFLASFLNIAAALSATQTPPLPTLRSFENAMLFAPQSRYQASPGQVNLQSGRVYLKPGVQDYQIHTGLGQLKKLRGELFVDLRPGKLTVAVEEGQALLQADEQSTLIQGGELAQLAEPNFDGPLDALGMDEGVDPALRTLAFAEPGTILTTLALSEAAVGSSILLPVLGGTAAAAGVASTVSSLLEAEEEGDTPPPISL